MDKKGALASYNNWKQNYKKENENMTSNQDLDEIKAMSLQISYSRKDSIPKSQSNLSKFALLSKKRTKARGITFSKFPTLKPKRLFGTNKKLKDEQNAISVLPTISEIDDASNSNSILLNDPREVVLRNAGNRKKESKPMTYWEKTAYEKICSEEPRLYFVYLSIFLILACALTASICAVQYVYQKGGESFDDENGMNPFSHNVYSISQYSNENLTFHVSNTTSKVEEVKLTTNFAAEKEITTIYQRPKPIHNEFISNSTIDISQSINATVFKYHTLSDSNPSMQLENTTKPGLGFEIKHLRNHSMAHERDTNGLPLVVNSMVNNSNHSPFVDISKTSATTDKSQFATNLTQEKN